MPNQRLRLASAVKCVTPMRKVLTSQNAFVCFEGFPKERLVMRSQLLFLNIRRIWAIKPLLLAIVTFGTLLLFGCATGDYVKPRQYDEEQTRNGFGSV
jgi:hypothetical protein